MIGQGNNHIMLTTNQLITSIENELGIQNNLTFYKITKYIYIMKIR